MRRFASTSRPTRAADRHDPPPARRSSRRHPPLRGRRSGQHEALQLGHRQPEGLRRRPAGRAAGRAVPLLELRLQPSRRGRRDDDELRFGHGGQRSVAAALGMKRTSVAGRRQVDPLLRGHRASSCRRSSVHRSERPLPVRRLSLDRRGPRPSRHRRHQSGFPRRQFADAPLHIPTDAGRGADGLRVRLRGRREPRRSGRGTHGQRRGRHAALLIHPRTRVVVALVTNVGFVTAPRPPDLSGTPEPPQLAMPFIRHVLRQSAPQG